MPAVQTKLQAKEERPLQSFAFKQFLALNTTNARTATPDQCLFQLLNAQPLGFANIRSVNDISSALHAFGADTIYYDLSVNIGGVEYLICASTTGKLFAYNAQTQAVTEIDGGTMLSGSSTAMTQWENSAVLIIDANGYFAWTGSGNMTAVTGTGTPTSGSSIAVYQSMVWIGQGRLLYFSVAGSYSDFTTTDGGGFSAIVDPLLRSSIIWLIAANGYLYIFGLTSVNAISDVYIPSGETPPTPTFTNLNISPVIGTDQPYSIGAYGRLITFANRAGIWSIYGTTVATISSFDPNNAYNSSIDGTYQMASFTQTVSAGQFISNSLFCVGFLVQTVSAGVTTTQIMVYQGNAAGGRWWFANWAVGSNQLTRITPGFLNGQQILYGYIGNTLYRLFAKTTSSPPAAISTALWDFGSPVQAKEAMRAGMALTILQAGSGVVSLTLDTETSSAEVDFSAPPGQVEWVNESDTVVTWINSANAPVEWSSTGSQTFWAQSPRGYGKYVGFTLNTGQGMQFELNSFLLDYKLAQRWTAPSQI